MQNENVKVELPITKPLITSYSPYATLYSILPCYENTDSWIYNNFINLWGQRGVGMMPIRFSSWNIMENCPFISYNILSRELAETLSENIIDFMISALSCGYYLFVPCDQYYLPVSEKHLNKHFRHCPFFYGFDKAEKVFLTGDFYNYGKFSCEKILFSDMAAAFINVKAIPVPQTWKSDFNWYDISLFKFKVHQQYQFNLDIVINSFNNYLQSKHSVLSFEQNILGEGEIADMIKGEFTFGIANYMVLSAELQKNKQEIVFKDPRPFHALYDHKTILIALLNYLGNKGYLHNAEHYIKQFNKIKDSCLNTRNLFLKFLFTSRLPLIDEITGIYKTVSAGESAIISELLEEL